MTKIGLGKLECPRVFIRIFKVYYNNSIMWGSHYLDVLCYNVVCEKLILRENNLPVI